MPVKFTSCKCCVNIQSCFLVTSNRAVNIDAAIVYVHVSSMCKALVFEQGYVTAASSHLPAINRKFWKCYHTNRVK